jgi:hypothetical protein
MLNQKVNTSSSCIIAHITSKNLSGFSNAKTTGEKKRKKNNTDATRTAKYITFPFLIINPQAKIGEPAKLINAG